MYWNVSRDSEYENEFYEPLEAKDLADSDFCYMQGFLKNII